MMSESNRTGLFVILMSTGFLCGICLFDACMLSVFEEMAKPGTEGMEARRSQFEVTLRNQITGTHGSAVAEQLLNDRAFVQKSHEDAMNIAITRHKQLGLRLRFRGLFWPYLIAGIAGAGLGSGVAWIVAKLHRST